MWLGMEMGTLRRFLVCYWKAGVRRTMLLWSKANKKRM
jgi:hypothetical protein